VPAVFDLIVVGAGPGGSRAAAAALAGGLEVLQLDAARFPRVKPCAGGLTPKALQVLPPEAGASLCGEYRDFEFNAWRGRRTVFSFQAPVVSMVERPELDARLVAENRARPGFVFQDGEPVRALEWTGERFRVRTPSGTFEARQLVGADGANGIVNRAFGLARPRGRALALELNLPRARLRADPIGLPCFDFGALGRGYGWVFPKERLVSVGLYTLERGIKDLRARLLAYLEAKGLRLRGDLPPFEAHTIPLGGHGLRASDLPLYLVGDAGGFADALTGEGIYHALESGRVAGETALDVARGRALPREYRARLEARVLRDTRWSWRLAGPFHRRPDLCLRLLCLSQLWRPLVHGTGSGATFGECLGRSAGFLVRSLRAGSVRRSSTVPVRGSASRA